MPVDPDNVSFNEIGFEADDSGVRNFKSDDAFGCVVDQAGGGFTTFISADMVNDHPLAWNLFTAAKNGIKVDLLLGNGAFTDINGNPVIVVGTDDITVTFLNVP